MVLLYAQKGQRIVSTLSVLPSVILYQSDTHSWIIDFMTPDVDTPKFLSHLYLPVIVVKEVWWLYF